ncbi:hypothetical protein PFISCL1PPCAC_18644 [Pristionchus fissidentatus]|uniref:C-type lectin n=1 Tax=Pristionchus fissidentatus TaxID=1538716 RepID=A0AAV5W8M4_9BILA|nr:hypothetical protein PFISCL1PPCAC_18644 [Pristionchus fissidentatus]
MLRFLLLLQFGIIFILADSQCPKNYQLMGDGRCIRSVYLDVVGKMSDMMSKGMEECKKDGAFQPIIRNDQENSMFNEIAFNLTKGITNSPAVILGLVCNFSTRRLEWMDGTKITYTYNNFNVNFDCVSTNYLVASYPPGDYWYSFTSTDSSHWTVLCVAEPRATGAQCGEYDVITNPKDSTNPCFKIFTDPLNWKDAQKKCVEDFGALATINSDEENKFFWRSAVAKNILNDMHIGAYQPQENVNVWKWIDGDKEISKGVYNNFHSVFPIPGGGSCTAMLTEESSAYWLNEDCTNQELPFICRRIEAKTSSLCPTVTPKEGEDIFAPGFPRPSTPCQYIFVVEANNVVQLEIITLETIKDVDFLLIYEGPVGSNLLANLTGSNPNPSIFMTKSSNVMRVDWKPAADVYRPPNARGFRIRYKSIATGK